MLNEFFNRHTTTPNQPESEDQASEALRTFRDLVSFLRDPKKLYNPNINQLIERMFPENERYPIKLGIEVKPKTPLGLLIIEDPVSRRDTSKILVAENFASHTHSQEALISLLRDVVHTASVGQDLFGFKLDPKFINDEIHFDETGSYDRSRAYQAELLLTLEAIAAGEQYPLTFTEIERRIMDDYPAGLMSLPEQLQPQLISKLYEIPAPLLN